MREDVIRRLESLGYTVDTGTDEWLINFLIDKVANTIKNDCNLTEIPAGLYEVAVDMVCGEFLAAKKGSGQLEGFDVDFAIKQIKEGDTNITFAVPDATITVDWLIKWLIDGTRYQFSAFRRLRW